MRPLYVRLPDDAADKLDSAAFDLKTPKQNLVAHLVSNHLTVGKAEFFPNDDPVVLTLDEAAELLRLDAKKLAKLALAVPQHPLPSSIVLRLGGELSHYLDARSELFSRIHAIAPGP